MTKSIIYSENRLFGRYLYTYICSTSMTFTSSPLYRSTDHFHAINARNSINPFTMMPMPSIPHLMDVDDVFDDNNEEPSMDESDTER